MKFYRNILAIGFLVLFSQGFGQQDFFNDAVAFFKKYAFDGRVSYSQIKRNPAELDNLIQQIDNYPMTDEIGNTNKAFYINAYNLLVIQQIVENYPVKSPEDIPGFFSSIPHQVAGSHRTLNQIENEILRPVYADSRIHFALVCGALGCPPIIHSAYHPHLLEQQLENQARLALNDPNFIRLEKGHVKLSEIFNWYGEDFLENAPHLITYINRYRKEPIPQDAKVSFYPYDWSLNDVETTPVKSFESVMPEITSTIYAYTPSILLKKGQVEAQLFNNIYTQTAYRNNEREKIELDTRDTYYSGLIYALYGINSNARINVGFDLNLKSVFSDTDKGSPLQVFGFRNTPHSRTALSSFGPKIKFQPFKQQPHFSVQSAFWIPLAKDLESVKPGSDFPWLDYQMFTWWNQFFYDFSPNPSWQIFTEADLLFRFKNGQGDFPSHLDVPVSLFVSWFPHNKMSVYAQMQYAPRLQLEKTVNADGDGQAELMVNPFSLISDFAHTGLGAKYQISQNLNLEISSTYFFTSKNGGAGWTYNLGFRVIL